MKVHKNHQKGFSLLISLILFSSQSLFVHASETNFWKERKSSLAKQTIELASLPQGLTPLSTLSLSRVLSPAHPLTSNPQLIKTGPLSRILQNLPTQYGSVRTVTQGQSDKVIIHIQDVHMNEEAQSNIGSAIQALIDAGQVDLVALEAAFGELDFSGYRNHNDPALVSELADFFLKEKLISGPIHTGIKSEKALPPMTGVDHPQHYWANVNAYRASEKYQPLYKEELKKANRALLQKKLTHYNKELKKFDETVQAFHTDDIKMGVYLNTLSHYAEDIYPEIEIFLEALKMEEGLDFSQVEKERSHLLESLSQKLKQKQMRTLLDTSVAYRMGGIEHSDFYQYLQNLCERNGVKLARFPAMRDYIQYLLLSDGIDGSNLFAEIRKLEHSIYVSLSKTKQEKNLIQQSRAHILIGKLLDFALTTEEWKEYKALPRCRENTN